MKLSYKKGIQRGFTLLELMAVVAIIAILATIAIPSFSEIIKNNRVASQNNEMIALINFAKSEAIRRSAVIDVNLYKSEGGWKGEVWLGDEQLRASDNTRVEIIFEGESLTFSFNSRGYLGTAGEWGSGETFNLKHVNCTPGSTRQQREIEIFPSGQFTSKEASC